ncbi:MAG: DUF4340 domain-containing protein [Candidatus Falkowbacteria bacterium]
MKNFKLFVILIILIAFAYIYQGPLKEWRSDLGKPDNFLAKINIDEIEKIEIIKNNNSVILEKEENKFKIAGTKDFYISEGLVFNLEEELKNASESGAELVSSNRDKKSEFQTDESGVNVKISKGEDVLADFVVGKRGTDFTSAYVSEIESEETYEIKANISGLFNRDVDNWYDKVIFNSDKEKINKLRFQYPDKELTAEKVDGQWNGIDEEKVEKVLNIMSDLSASKIPKQTFEGTDLEKNLIIAQATGEGVDNTLMIGTDNGESLYYAKKGDSDNIYLIGKDQRDTLIIN